MQLPVTDLQRLYQMGADALIDDVNATPVILVYPPLESTPTHTLFTEPSMVDLLGGRTSIEYLPGRSEASGSNQSVMAITGSFLVRAYWNDKLFEKALLLDNVGKPDQVCRIVSYTTDVQALLNADHIIVDGNRCKRISAATPHGLFGDKRYSTTFWELF